MTGTPCANRVTGRTAAGNGSVKYGSGGATIGTSRSGAGNNTHEPAIGNGSGCGCRAGPGSRAYARPGFPGACTGALAFCV